LEKSLETTIETYNSFAETYMENTRNRRPVRELNAFCGEVAPAGVILDAGCAGGRDCATFIERGFTVIGVDLSPKMIELAKQRNLGPRCTFHMADMRHMPFCGNNEIDGIWCCASLLHLPRAETGNALKEFRRVLCVGGVCCIIVKEGKKDEEPVPYSPGGTRYFTYFQLDELREQCRTMGFSVIDGYVTRARSSIDPDGPLQKWIYLLLKQNFP
jgi:SAM-dependent methyltransferase